MYPRNAASPEPIAIGAVVQITDGAVQSSGVTVRVKAAGQSEADGGGTTAYSTDGVVLYTPTQAETNYTSFVLIAKKTNCIPASVTVVTSASATTGYAGLDWAKLTGATTTVNLSGTTISTSQAVASVSGAVGSVTGAVGSVTSRVTANTDQWGGVAVTGMPMPTYTQPTGFLAATFPGTVSSFAGGAVASVTGNVGGNVVGSVGSISGVTFPTHFSDLEIAANGHVSAAVQSIANNSITASSIQGGAITAAKFATDAITAAALAADAVAEIQAGLATAANQTTILNRLGAFTGSGVNTILGFLKAIMSKTASTPSDVGGSFSAATDAIEAIRDAQQAGTGDASQATLEAVQDTVDAIAAAISGTSIEVVSRVADGGAITLYAGDDARVRSGTEIAVSISDVGGAIHSRLDSIGIANLAFGASRPSQPAGAIQGTVAALTVVGAGASQTLRIDLEIEDAGERLAWADNYVWQIVSSTAQGSEYDTWTEVEGTLAVKRRVAVPVYS